MMYPSKAWEQYERIFKDVGENRGRASDDAEFLRELGLVTEDRLSVDGQSYFDARFVLRDEAATIAAMQPVLMRYRPAMAISQRLYGVPHVDKVTVETVLRNVGMGEGLTDRKLGSLLSLLARFGIISYVKSQGEIVALQAPLEAGQVPPVVFISRETPFSNIMWLTRVLRECRGHIYWLDKHFQVGGLEAIADACDGNRLSEVRVLSLKLPANSTGKVMKSYKALKKELLIKEIALEWRFIDSSHVRDSHDRWIIGSDTARNVPDVGTVMSGNKSEISMSSSVDRLNSDFLAYWVLAVEAN